MLKVGNKTATKIHLMQVKWSVPNLYLKMHCRIKKLIRVFVLFVNVPTLKKKIDLI
jgi:hypothetical protein